MIIAMFLLAVSGSVAWFIGGLLTSILVHIVYALVSRARGTVSWVRSLASEVENARLRVREAEAARRKAEESLALVEKALQEQVRALTDDKTRIEWDRTRLEEEVVRLRVESQKNANDKEAIARALRVAQEERNTAYSALSNLSNPGIKITSPVLPPPPPLIPTCSACGAMVTFGGHVCMMVSNKILPMSEFIAPNTGVGSVYDDSKRESF